MLRRDVLKGMLASAAVLPLLGNTPAEAEPAGPPVYVPDTLHLAIGWVAVNRNFCDVIATRVKEPDRLHPGDIRANLPDWAYRVPLNYGYLVKPTFSHDPELHDRVTFEHVPTGECVTYNLRKAMEITAETLRATANYGKVNERVGAETLYSCGNVKYENPDHRAVQLFSNLMAMHQPDRWNHFCYLARTCNSELRRAVDALAKPAISQLLPD